MAYPHYLKNYNVLKERFIKRINQEDYAYNSGNAEEILSRNCKAPYVGNSTVLEQERICLLQNPLEFPNRMFSITYSGGYFGIQQSIQIDSINYALRTLRDRGIISEDQSRWLMLALCLVLKKVATTTGHFAQFLSPKSNNLKRYISQRRRSIWYEWLSVIDEMEPYGTKHWRKGNRVFNVDALSLLQSLRNQNKRPTVIYADPPYSRDQYSRFYHIYETLIKYDYPLAIGKGRYRPDRFRTPFSTKSKVVDAFKALIRLSANVGSQLILSYPEKGILHSVGENARQLLKEEYSKVEIAEVIEHHHSSLGGSTGVDKYPIKELIYIAR